MTQSLPIPTTLNRKALVGTIGVHALLLLLFFLMRYNTATLPETIDEGGLEVNLGNSDNGSGQDQPEQQGNPANLNTTVIYKDQSTDQQNLPKDMLASNEADAPVVDNSKPTKATTDAPKPKNELKKPLPNPKAVYQGGDGKGGNTATQNVAGTNEGDGTGPGDKGVPGGTVGATNYTGTPGNGGIGHTLTGRKISPDRFEAEFSESGKVVIRVTVDRDGNIVSRIVKSSSNPQLTKLAMDKLSHAKFSKSSGSEPQQFGDVTIVFKTR